LIPNFELKMWHEELRSLSGPNGNLVKPDVLEEDQPVEDLE